MKLIVDVPHEIICKRYIGANDQIWMVHAIKNGKPLSEELNDIKGEIKAEIDTDLSCDMFDEYGNETRLHKDLMNILDNIGKEK